MKTRDIDTLKIIIKHKEYFDQRLIEITDASLKSCEEYKLKMIQSDKYTKSLQYKILNLKDDLKKKEEEVDNLNDALAEYLKRLQEIERDVDVLHNEINRLNKENAEIKKERDQIKNKLNKIIKSNSTNSNMPSSFDVLSHSKRIINSREKTNRKKGGQLGHKVHKNKLFDNPDIIRELKVKNIPTGAIKKEDYYLVQEVDLSIRKMIIETRFYQDDNGIELDDDTLNKYRINPVTYSDDIKALAIYLNQRSTIPLNRLNELFKDILDVDLKESTIVNWTYDFNCKAEHKKEEILHNLRKANIIHIDETSAKLNGGNIWFHTLSNNDYSYYKVTKERSKGYLDLMNYKGYLVHDHYKPYYNLKGAKHVECNAHIDRYLKSAYEFDNSQIANEILNLLHKAKKNKEELISKSIDYMDDSIYTSYKDEMLRLLNLGLNDADKYKDSRYKPEYINLFKRMIAYIDEHLKFLKDFSVPYSNNEAERQCRRIKSKKKISGQFTSFDSAIAYATISSIIQTANKQKIKAIDAIKDIYKINNQPRQ